jgi:hypothetical protein
MRRLAVDRGRWKEFVEAPLTHHGEENEEEEEEFHLKKDDLC